MGSDFWRLHGMDASIGASSGAITGVLTYARGAELADAFIGAGIVFVVIVLISPPLRRLFHKSTLDEKLDAEAHPTKRDSGHSAI